VYLVISEVVFPAYDQASTGSGDITAREDELRKLRQVLGRRGRYETLFAETNKRVQDLETRLLGGPTAVRASGELQTMVEDSARKSGLNLTQRSVVPSNRKDRFLNEVGLSMNFESTPAQLMSFLADLRSAPKFLKITSAQVTPVQVATEPPTSGELTKNLRVSLTIVGMFSDAAEPAGGQK
jgi:hypothetical protein